MYGVFSFFSTIAVYNGQRLFKASKTPATEWLRWVHKNQRGIFLVVVFASTLSLLTFIQLQQLDWRTFALLSISGLISIFYVLKIRGVNMREIPYLKIHLIAFTWVVVLLIFPILNEKVNVQILPIAIAHYLYVVAISIPFDIRDLRFDNPSQKTIPQLLGVISSKILAFFLLGLFFFILVYTYPTLLFNPFFYLATFAQAVLILIMNESRSDFYCAGLIDGAIGLLGLSYFWM